MKYQDQILSEAIDQRFYLDKGRYICRVHQHERCDLCVSRVREARAKQLPQEPAPHYVDNHQLTIVVIAAAMITALIYGASLHDCQKRLPGIEQNRNSAY